MKTPLLSITEGWTQRLGPFVARADGVPVALPTVLDNPATAVLQIRGHGLEEYVDTDGDVEVDPDQVTNIGQFSFDPDAADFEHGHSPYTFRLKVTDSDGKIAYFPNGEADLIRVFKP